VLTYTLLYFFGLENSMSMVTIYVLELEDCKYYVGQSAEPRKRIRQHFKGKGCEWTRRYNPVRKLLTKKKAYISEEDTIARQFMFVFGMENVRGGKYVKIDLADCEKKDIRSSFVSEYGLCFICLKTGHFGRRCPNRKSKWLDITDFRVKPGSAMFDTLGKFHPELGDVLEACQKRLDAKKGERDGGADSGKHDVGKLEKSLRINLPQGSCQIRKMILGRKAHGTIIAVKISGGDVTDDLLGFLGTHCVHLERFEILDGGVGTEVRVTSLEVCLWVKKCKQLKWIDLIGNRKSLDNGLKMIAKVCGCRLEHLNISRSFVTDAGIMAIGRDCPLLKFVSIHAMAFDYISDKGVCGLSKGCGSLEYINVSGLKLSDRSVIAIARGCPSLTYLSLRDMARVTDTGVEKLANKCLLLRELDLGVTKISREACLFLPERCKVSRG